MPIYEYQCEDCGHEMEAMQKMADDPLKECPSCGKPGLRKLVSASAFRLKGGGWYETDFKNGNQKNIAKGDKSSDSDSSVSSASSESSTTKSSSAESSSASSSSASSSSSSSSSSGSDS